MPLELSGLEATTRTVKGLAPCRLCYAGCCTRLCAPRSGPHTRDEIWAPQQMQWTRSLVRGRCIWGIVSAAVGVSASAWVGECVRKHSGGWVEPQVRGDAPASGGLRRHVGMGGARTILGSSEFLVAARFWGGCAKGHDRIIHRGCDGATFLYVQRKQFAAMGTRPSGYMDTASAYGGRNCRLESCGGHCLHDRMVTNPMCPLSAPKGIAECACERSKPTCNLTQCQQAADTHTSASAMARVISSWCAR